MKRYFPHALLANSAQMRALDRQTIESIGIPGAVLMENAGRATVDHIERAFGPVAGKTVCIFIGPGNNGGDGLVIARTIYNRGGFPLSVMLVPSEQLKGDAALNDQIVRNLGLAQLFCTSREELAQLGPALAKRHPSYPLHSLVDAIFGIGLERPLQGHFLEALRMMKALRHIHHCPLVAVDLPSGLHSDTGQILGEAAEADLCVTYGLAKPAHYHHGGALCGRLEVVDIGIPPALLDHSTLQGAVLDARLPSILEPRSRIAHKGDQGHLLIVAGSKGKSGAALLCGQGALRSGAGLVTFAAPSQLQLLFASSLVEAMSAPLPHSKSCFVAADLPSIEQLCAKKQALVLGPGIGLDAETVDFTLKFYQTCALPMVVDADALSILANHPKILARPGGPRIFTPHPAEMARLLASSVTEVQQDRLQAAQRLCSLAQPKDGKQSMIVILKGAGTVLASNHGPWAINASGNAGMATGGMGDVLAGIVAGMIVQGYPLWRAACLGVYLHGAAADLIAQQKPYGYTASELATMLPQLIGLHLGKGAGVDA